MKVQPTAGTWHHDADEQPAGCSLSIFNDDTPIATVLNVDDFPCIEDDNNEAQIAQIDAEARATARLIAAAPNLLDALKVTAGNIRSLGQAGALDAVPMLYREWLRVVEDAIAKAEGRS